MLTIEIFAKDILIQHALMAGCILFILFTINISLILFLSVHLFKKIFLYYECSERQLESTDDTSRNIIIL